MKNLYALTAKLMILIAFLGLHLPKVKAQTDYTISGTTFLDYGGNKTLDSLALKHPALKVLVYESSDEVFNENDKLLDSAVSNFKAYYEIAVPETSNAPFYLLRIDPSSIFASAPGTLLNTTVVTRSNIINRDTMNVSFEGQPVACYATADQENKLVAVNRVSGAYDVSNSTFGNGVNEIETVAFDLGGKTLYAENKGTLGTIDLTTGEFTPKDNSITQNGRLWDADSTNSIGINDADGMTFDPYTGRLYATVRRDSPLHDILISIDPETGLAERGIFENGADYISIVVDTSIVMENFDRTLTYLDIDDIAISPADGQLYGVVSDGSVRIEDEDLFSETVEFVIRINKFTGENEIIDVLSLEGIPIQDVEGFGFTNFGLLVASTGSATKGFEKWGREVRNSTFEVEVNSAGNLTGKLKQFSTFEETGRLARDIEGCDCLIAPINTVSGKVYLDADTDGIRDTVNNGTNIIE